MSPFRINTLSICHSLTLPAFLSAFISAIGSSPQSSCSSEPESPKTAPPVTSSLPTPNSSTLHNLAQLRPMGSFWTLSHPGSRKPCWPKPRPQFAPKLPYAAQSCTTGYTLPGAGHRQEHRLSQAYFHSCTIAPNGFVFSPSLPRLSQTDPACPRGFRLSYNASRTQKLEGAWNQIDKATNI